MIPVSIDIEITTQHPRSVQTAAVAKAAKVFNVSEDDLEVTFLSDGKAVDYNESMWRFIATVTWTPKADF